MIQRVPRWMIAVLGLGYLFLYLPISILMAYSFNDSSLASVWTGFSLRWYTALLENEQIIDAALLSLQIAAISATAATILGTLAAMAITHMGTFRGRALFTGMLAAPLVMPEVITGLSLLLFFGRPRRCDHHVGPHHLLHGFCRGGCAITSCNGGPFFRRSRHGPWGSASHGRNRCNFAHDRTGHGGRVVTRIHPIVR